MISTKILYRRALLLALFTILYNIAEGLAATILGYEDESLALFGFGLDSFIEVVSGFGIFVMILRIKNNPESLRGSFEKNALKLTGSAFYILFAGLIVSSIYNIVTAHKPETTLWGVIISVISIIIMLLLLYGKRNTGNQLHSEAILADANCTKVCIYMSIILLLSSGLYELTGFPYFDSIGTLGLAWFSFTEGRECFEKAKNEKYCACNCHT